MTNAFAGLRRVGRWLPDFCCRRSPPLRLSRHRPRSPTSCSLVFCRSILAGIVSVLMLISSAQTQASQFWPEISTNVKLNPATRQTGRPPGVQCESFLGMVPVLDCQV